MFDIVLYVTDLFLKATGSHDPQVRREREQELRDILDAIEAEYVNGTDDVRDLILVSFLESLPTPDEEAAEIRFHLGRVLRAEVERIWPFPDAPGLDDTDPPASTGSG